jgi:hypothetical protein
MYSQSDIWVRMRNQKVMCHFFFMCHFLSYHLVPYFSFVVLRSRWISSSHCEVFQVRCLFSSSVIQSHIVRMSLRHLRHSRATKVKRIGQLASVHLSLFCSECMYTVSWWCQPKAAAFSSARKFKVSASFIGSLLATSTAWIPWFGGGEPKIALDHCQVLGEASNISYQLNTYLIVIPSKWLFYVKWLLISEKHCLLNVNK